MRYSTSPSVPQPSESRLLRIYAVTPEGARVQRSIKLKYISCSLAGVPFCRRPALGGQVDCRSVQLSCNEDHVEQSEPSRVPLTLTPLFFQGFPYIPKSDLPVQHPSMTSSGALRPESHTRPSPSAPHRDPQCNSINPRAYRSTCMKLFDASALGKFASTTLDVVAYYTVSHRKPCVIRSPSKMKWPSPPSKLDS